MNILNQVLKKYKNNGLDEKDFVKFLDESIFSKSIDNIVNIFLNRNNEFYKFKQLT